MVHKKFSKYCFCYRVYDQFTLEIILSTVFGQPADILRGKAENDELYKIVNKIIEFLSLEGSTGLLGIIAIQCKLSFLAADNVVKVSFTLLCFITAHIPQILNPLLKTITKWFFQPPSKSLMSYTKTLVQARRRMNLSNKVCYDYIHNYNSF